MNINVNCGKGCGGCGCGCSGENQPPQSYQTPAPVTGGNPSPIDSAGLQAKCDAANYLIYSLRLAGIQSVNWSSGYEGWADFWADMFAFLPDPNLRTFAYYPYVTILALLNGIPNTQVVTTPLDEFYNELVCIVYSAENSQVAADNVLDKLNQVYADYVVRHMMTEIASQLPYDMAFGGGGAFSIPATFSGRDCSGCGFSQEQLPAVPSGFYWAALEAGHVTNFAVLGTSGIAITAVGNTFTMTKSQTSQRTDQISIDVDALKTAAGGSPSDIRQAYLVRYLDSSYSPTTDDTYLNAYVNPVNVPPNSRAGWTNTNRYQFRWRSGHLAAGVIDDIESQLDEYATLSVAIAGGSEDNLGSSIGFLLNSANASEFATMRIWYLVEAV